MANVLTKNFGSISSGDTVENCLIVEGDYVLDDNGNVEALIEVTNSAGGIQFSNNAAIDGDQRLFITGSKFYATFAPSKGLYFKQSANGDTFSIAI